MCLLTPCIVELGYYWTSEDEVVVFMFLQHVIETCIQYPVSLRLWLGQGGVALHVSVEQ
jgi:hypothetical protein